MDLYQSFRFLGYFHQELSNSTITFICHYILFVQIRLQIFLSVVLQVFKGREENRIVLSDTDMEINNTETWKSVN